MCLFRTISDHIPILELHTRMTLDIRNNYFTSSFVFLKFYLTFIQKLVLKAEFTDILFLSNALSCVLSRNSEVAPPYTPLIAQKIIQSLTAI